MNQQTFYSGGRRLTDRVRKRAKSVRKAEDFSNTFGGPSRADLLVPAKGLVKPFVFSVRKTGEKRNHLSY